MVSAGPTRQVAAQRRRTATTLYLDTSARVKRYTAEPGSRTVRAAMTAARLRSTSVVTYAEMHSALLRAQRDGRLDAAGYAAAVALVTAHWPGYVRLAVDDALALEAGRL